MAFAALPPGIAQALPGENVRTVVAAAQRKSFHVHTSVSEMSGMAMYNATASYKGATVLYHIEDTASHRSYQELVRYDAPNFRFLRRSDRRVRTTISMVYGDALAQDFLRAHVVATVGSYRSRSTNTFFGGVRFAYRASGDELTLFARKDLAAEIAVARRCATMECGD